MNATENIDFKKKYVNVFIVQYVPGCHEGRNEVSQFILPVD